MANNRTSKFSEILRRGLVPALSVLMITAGPAGATQTHSDPEGLVVHQFSHIFFLFSMGLLIYWIRTRGLKQKTGWRHIQYAAALFMIWTMDAFATHLMDEHYEWVRMTQAGPWRVHIEAVNLFTAIIYYLAKMDHLWCVPALLFMYLGLKRLNEESRFNAQKEQPPGGTEP